MRIGVTGGAGYIGSTLVKKLIIQGDEVVSVDNETIGDYSYLENDVYGRKSERIIGDIRNLDLLKNVWKDSNAIAHLAALPGLVLCNERPEEAVSVNIYGTYQVLEAARLLDINKVVFCSSASVYGVPMKMPVTEEHGLRPLNLYGVTKVAGEKIMNSFYDNYGIETVNLRFGNIYGVGIFTRYNTVIPKFVKQALTGNELTIYGDGEYTRDFIHVEDITSAIMLGLSLRGIGGEVFNVGGETMSVNEIAKIVKEEIWRSRKIKVKSIITPPRKGETKKFSYNLKKIREKMGFTNSWNVSSGVKQLVDYSIKYYD